LSKQNFPFDNLEQTSIALSLATTIHCSWVSAVHIRISMELNIIHLHWTFFAFGLATILFAIDCMSSIIRLVSFIFDIRNSIVF